MSIEINGGKALWAKTHDIVSAGALVRILESPAKRNVKRVKFMPPSFGSKHFGRFMIEYNMPSLSYGRRKDYGYAFR